MKEKTVFVAVVKTKHIYSDIFQWIRNMLGMNLVAYERMIEGAVAEGITKIETMYPGVYDIRISTSQVSNGAAEIIVYGKVITGD